MLIPYCAGMFIFFKNIIYIKTINYMERADVYTENLYKIYKRMSSSRRIDANNYKI